jgi:uncharacterized YigZ family protein
MDSYKTIKERASFEYEDRKSVFIGDAMPVSTEAEALAFIEMIKKKYPDARHHVYAYVLRENNTTRFTDDSEPQGTAGMPTLDVIRKNGCTDMVIVVTRYFGGTLLGTGGLVRAYTQAALGALNRGIPVVYDIYSALKITVSYSDHGRIIQALDEFGFVIDDTIFAANVEIIGRIKASEVQQLLARLTEITSARAQVEELGQKFDCL